MQNTNTTPQRLELVGFYESPTGRWHVSQDRTWKVHIDINDEVVAIRDSRKVYRLIGGATFDTRARRRVSPGSTIHQDVVALAAQARRIESQ